MRRVFLIAVLLAMPVCTYARVDAVRAAACAGLGRIAALTAMQRIAGTPEDQLRKQAMELVSDNSLPALLMLIHTVYTEPDVRRLSPAETGEAYRMVCLTQAPQGLTTPARGSV